MYLYYSIHKIVYDLSTDRQYKRIPRAQIEDNVCTTHLCMCIGYPPTSFRVQERDMLIPLFHKEYT